MSASAPEYPLAAGTIVRDTYTVEEVLGAGAFSTVYAVRHRFLGAQAMKVFTLTPGVVDVPKLLGEARLLTGLVDAHIVRVFEANTAEMGGRERPYMTMELIRGGSLEDVLQRKTRLNPLSALKTARQICAALAVTHRLTPSVVHRDVKPQNVLVQSVSVHGTPQVKVGDFGLAKAVDPDSRMTQAGGTIQYLAPESVWGIHTPASDVYATGVVLYRMLTGLFPFPVTEASGQSADERRDLFARARRTSPTPPSRYALGLPAEIDSIALRALATEAKDRFPHGGAFGKQLDRLVAELT